MNWQNIIAELLYIGIVAEKGRCYGVRWKYGYKKTLRKHIKALNLLQVSLQSDNIEKKKDALNSFINICNKNRNYSVTLRNPQFLHKVEKWEGSEKNQRNVNIQEAKKVVS